MYSLLCLQTTVAFKTVLLLTITALPALYLVCVNMFLQTLIPHRK